MSSLNTIRGPLFDTPSAPKPSPDICRRKHGGNEKSEVANEVAQPHKASMRERVRIFVAGCGFSGATIKEVAAAFGKQLNQLSGRFTELRCNEQIFDSRREREGCAVYVARKEWVTP